MTLDVTDPVALARALIQCRSVTPEEGGALTLLQSVLEPLGFVCERVTFQEAGTPDVENLYARRGTGGANLCFAGHTDVVPPGDAAAWHSDPFAAEIRDGLLYGRGAVDMKGAIACFVAAVARAIAAGEDTGSVSLLITGDEEGPSINGTVKVLQWLAERGERLDAAIVGEPSNPDALGDEIKIGRRGSVTGELVVYGVQGHAAYPHRADNPLPSNCQVTIVSVPNTAANVIPAFAAATFNIRYNDIWRRATIEEWVRLQCEAAALATGARYDVSFAGTGDVFLTERGPLVDTLSSAVQAVTGRTPGLSTSGGTSDARFIKDYCPVVEFGLVNRTIHQVDECVPLQDLERLTEIYRLAVLRIAKAVDQAAA
ncbi:MAG: succinyl-diaminopimelate desuccinylase [Hyphomicrobium sp. 32-62-53]|nr:MAG: succinyl-diaminopimelate desuccinylase [Hyphomicrobium sp. 32-62-53]